MLDPASKSGRDHFVLQSIFKTLALLEGDWKYIPNNSSKHPVDFGRDADPRNKRFAQARINEDTLLNLRDDPQEATNVISEHAQKAKELSSKLAEIVAKQ